MKAWEAARRPVVENVARLESSLRALADRLSALGRTRAGRVTLLLVIMILGALLRLEPLYQWLGEPDSFFYLDQPLERSLDGYRILTHARDLLEGDYRGLDRRRQVPDYIERPWPPMLLAILAAGLHQVTGVGLNWIAALLPVLLGSLVALPLYALGRVYGGTAMGLASALLGTLATMSVARSSFAWFDTDCLNVTLLLATAYFALRFGTTQGRRRYLYFGIHALLVFVYVWWWWPIRPIALGMSSLPLAVALLLHYRAPRRETLVFLACLAAYLALTLVVFRIDPSDLFAKVQGLYGYVAQLTPAGKLPTIGAFNAEQMRVPPGVMADRSAGGLLGFALGWAGIAWLFLRRFRTALYLLSLATVSLLATFFALRFLIFLSVFLSLGIGFLLARAWHLRARFAWTALLPFLVLPSVLWPQIETTFERRESVQVSPRLAGALATSGRRLPEDAVIWSKWDNGNPILYWSDRGTVGDGDYHGAELMIYNFLPLAADNDRLAANFMRFYIARGREGARLWIRVQGGDRARAFARLRRLLSAGPQGARRLLAADPPSTTEEGSFSITRGERSKIPLDPPFSKGEGWMCPDLSRSYEEGCGPADWVEFLFPPQARPLFLLLDLHTARTLNTWWPLATWDYAAGAGSRDQYLPMVGIELDLSSPDAWKDALIAFSKRHSGFGVDPNAGIMRLQGGELALKRLVFVHAGRTRVLDYGRSSGYHFEVNADTGVGALADAAVAASLFNRLFLRQSPSRHFLPVDLGAPDYQLWEVRGDRP